MRGTIIEPVRLGPPDRCGEIDLLVLGEQQRGAQHVGDLVGELLVQLGWDMFLRSGLSLAHQLNLCELADLFMELEDLPVARAPPDSGSTVVGPAAVGDG